MIKHAADVAGGGRRVNSIRYRGAPRAVLQESRYNIHRSPEVKSGRHLAGERTWLMGDAGGNTVFERAYGVVSQAPRARTKARGADHTRSRRVRVTGTLRASAHLCEPNEPTGHD